MSEELEPVKLWTCGDEKLREEIDTLRKQVEQLLVIQRDWGILAEERLDYENNLAELQRKLDIAVRALVKYSDESNWNEYTYDDGKYAGSQLAQNALAEIDDVK